MDPPADAGVEVVFARPDRQRVVSLPWQDGMTASQAVEASGLAREFPEILAQPLQLGIFGQRVDAHRTLLAGDRVEIYRPLPQDPKERRRRRAAEAGAPGRGRNR
jgi:putative ubiquitin-RnfH superfamily antitoxin RatB of RatAB toxin-antitoxin module